MTTAAASPHDTNAASVPCPRCKNPLVDPAGLRWCKACGYCGSLAESQTVAARTPEVKPAKPNSVTATGSALKQTPLWFWITLVGLAAVVGATYACGRWLTFTPLQRAMFTSLQILGGLGLMFAGQFLGLLKVAPEDATLGFKDAVFPFRLYGLVMRYLPGTRFTVYFGVWGLAAAISAGIFIGGMGHWFTYLPGNEKTQSKKNKYGL